MRAHRDAIVAELETRLPNSVFTSFTAKNPPTRYAVVFVAETRRERHRFTGPQGRRVFTVTVHSIGHSEEQCLWVAERVGELTDKVLKVPDRSLWPVEYVTGMPPDVDDDDISPLWFLVSQFDIVSDPA